MVKKTIMIILLLSLLAGCTANGDINLQEPTQYEFIGYRDAADSNSPFTYTASQNLAEYFPEGCTLIGIENDSMYSAVYLDDGRLMVYELADYKSPSPVKKLLYETKDFTFGLFSDMQNGCIYLSTVNVHSGKFYFDLIEISKDGSSNIIYSSEATRTPIIYSFPGHIIVTTTHNNGTRMMNYDLAKRQVNTIKETTFSLDKNGNITGDYLLFGGSLDNIGFYYELINLKNEGLEVGGSSNIFYYSFENKEETLIMQPDKKSLFITGDHNTLLASEYELDYPWIITGKIYQLAVDDNCTNINQIQPGHDLQGAKKINQFIVSFNNQDIFVFDTNKLQYAIYPYCDIRNLSEVYTSKIFIDKTAIYYLQFSNGEITLFTLNLKKQKL